MNTVSVAVAMTLTFVSTGTNSGSAAPTISSACAHGTASGGCSAAPSCFSTAAVPPEAAILLL